MPLSMYDSTAPVFLRALDNLRNILRKGETYAIEKPFAPEILLQARLAPDMFPLTRQVQIATDMAKNGCARLAGVDPMAFPDEEKTFAELDARIERAAAYIREFTREQIDGSEERAVTIKIRGEDKTFDGRSYLQGFVIPNLYFHSTTTYAILRHCGVPLGKQDFMGAPR